MITVDPNHSYDAEVVFVGESLEDYAKNLFSALRSLDKKVDCIIVEGCDETELGLAIMNRLRKAANSVLKF